MAGVRDGHVAVRKKETARRDSPAIAGMTERLDAYMTDLVVAAPVEVGLDWRVEHTA